MQGNVLSSHDIKRLALEIKLGGLPLENGSFLSVVNAVKYIVVTGGVTSSLGKGIIAASLGKLLQARGYQVAIQKLDPYLNVDPGTMSPLEHGECYVTEDGTETDLDLGHYERFLDMATSRANSVTAGSIYHAVLSYEREGNYLGKTVQVIPHITDEIKRRVFALSKEGDYDFVIVEVGGSVGDMELLPFLEAIRQMRGSLAAGHLLSVHLTLIPYLKATQELKTKPTQHAVRQLQAAGIQPDMLVCRTEKPLSRDLRRKISLLCGVAPNAVIEALDTSSVYEVPLLMRKEQLDKRVLTQLCVPLAPASELASWEIFVDKLCGARQTVRIGLVGKYTAMPDAYKSVIESLVHAGAHHACRVDLQLIPAEQVDGARVDQRLQSLHGMVVAGGFGKRGVEGKMKAIWYARTHQVPFLGICLGMQCAVVEFARNVLGWERAASTEQNPDTLYPVVTLADAQVGVVKKGGTTRLGAQSCQLKPGTKVAESYGTLLISERHRHRYEVNSQYLQDLEKVGMTVSGTHPETGLVEIVELIHHRWFVGTQFHPELKSTPLRPHPLFVSFVREAKARMG